MESWRVGLIIIIVAVFAGLTWGQGMGEICLL